MKELDFNPENPFPLLEIRAESYAAAKRHSQDADAWLGLRVSQVEQRLTDPEDGQERWIKRHSSIFLTPFAEVRAWLEEVQPRQGETVIDLGAGYGRVGFVMARHFPEASFLGFELVEERVREGAAALARFGALKATLLQANIAEAEWAPPPAEIYFIYDYGTKAAIAKTLGDLRRIAQGRGIRVVGRGRAVRDQIEREHPWLGSVYAPLHRSHYSIYRTFA